jgi:predicted anti-sigma-YlaC factor YlaD
MDCKEFRESLDLYADGELAPEAEATARVHLHECAACRRAEAELLRLRRALKRTVAQQEPPPELVRRVAALTNPRWRLLWQRHVSLPAPVFALLLLLIVALLVGTVGATLRQQSKSKQSAVAPPVAQQIAPANQPQSGLDLARFDHGARATIYKIRRTQTDGAQ